MIYKLNVGKINTMQFGDIQYISDDIFFAGCSRRCPTCFNKDLWNPSLGDEQTPIQIFNRLSKVKWVCLIGGEPLEQDTESLRSLVDLLHKSGKKITLFTSVLNPWHYISVDHYHIDIKPFHPDKIPVPPKGVGVSYGVIAQPDEVPCINKFKNIALYNIYIKSLNGIHTQTTDLWVEVFRAYGLSPLVDSKIYVDNP